MNNCTVDANAITRDGFLKRNTRDRKQNGMNYSQTESCVLTLLRTQAHGSIARDIFVYIGRRENGLPYLSHVSEQQSYFSGDIK